MFISRASGPRAVSSSNSVVRLDRHPTPAMSEGGARRVERVAANHEGVGSVYRRPAADVVEEMRSLASVERRRMTTPVPPTPRPPEGFWIERRPPPPPCRQTIHPYIPPTPDRAEMARVAAVRARAHEESEAWHIARADELLARPREPSPPRAADDVYDLARWNRRRWWWSQRH